jgi:hypothetical protein
MIEKVITIFTKGKEGCEHEFVYSKHGKAEFTFPIKFTGARICKHCGQHEMVELNSIPKTSNDFTEIVERFTER